MDKTSKDKLPLSSSSLFSNYSLNSTSTPLNQTSINLLSIYLSPLFSLLFCFYLCLSYVIFLYIWADKQYSRDHPKTIKSRFQRVTVCCLVSLLSVYLITHHDPNGKTFLSLVGLTTKYFFSSFFVSLFITMILFSGPLCQIFYNNFVAKKPETRQTRDPIFKWIWIRNHIMGPLTEEIVYRGCMLPVLLPSFGPHYSLVICPLFFGSAHFHHACASIMEGDSLEHALTRSCFQFFYTTIFGIYSAFLFVRTENLLSCITVHVFCNFMGFPDLPDLLSKPQPVKRNLILIYIIGFLLFCCFVSPLTNPTFL